MVGVAALLAATGCSCDDESDGDSGSAGDHSGVGGSAGQGTGHSTGGTSSTADDDAETGGQDADDDGDDASGGTDNGGAESGGDSSTAAAGSNAGQGGATEGGAAGTPGVAGIPEQTAGAGGVEPSEGGGTSLPMTGGTSQGGSTEVGGGGGASGAPNPPAPPNLEDLIGSICDWEFRCCDRGELDYRLGSVVTDSASCKARFVQELSSNATENPYASGSARGLLGTLAYTIDLERVEVNTDNLEACIAEYDGMGCAQPLPKVTPHCAGPVTTVDPCAITSLFNPILEAGDRCTRGLSELATNDVECVPGTTCLTEAEGSPESFPTCVTRGTDGSFCTNDGQCDFDFYCNESGVCAEKPGLGEDCAYSSERDPVPGELDVACKSGLTCNPVSGVCAAVCTTGNICSGASAAADLECPEGESCAPLPVSTSDQDLFHACRALGDRPADACDDDGDCTASRFCDDGACVADGGPGDNCADTGECEAGLYCDDFECALYLELGDECARGSGGDPAITDACGNPEGPMFCVYDAEEEGTFCVSERLETGDECETDSDCQSGLCEQESDGEDAPRTCSAGAASGDDCDSDSGSPEALRCGPGLACIEGSCVTQVGTGESCEDDSGEGSSLLCANGSCDDQWDAYICTDAPVQIAIGGTGLTCDGGEAE